MNNDRDTDREEFHFITCAFQAKYATAYYLINKEHRPKDSYQFGLLILELFPREYELLRAETLPKLEQYMANVTDNEPMDAHDYLKRQA